MKTLDYKLLLALDAVIREQNFERAAQRLHITQSAISQRIKQLEQQFAEPLIIRSQPLQATGLGQKLLAHISKGASSVAGNVLTIEDEADKQRRIEAALAHRFNPA